MSGIIDKMKTLWWYLSRPSYSVQLIQLFRRFLNRRKEDTRAEAVQWCRQVAIPMEEVLHRLGIGKIEYPWEVYPDYWREAENRYKQVPIVMGGAGAVEFIFTVVRKFKPVHLVETGVAYGWSTLAMLLGTLETESARVISTDMPYPKMGNEPYVGYVIPENLRERWTLIRKPDVLAVPLAIKYFGGEIDFLHYDSDKSYTGRMFSYPRLWKALRNGGIFISDDIQDNIAFKEFSENIGIEPLVFEYKGKYVGVLRK